MTLQIHDIEMFFDLIADMPDIEAIDELDGRIDAIRSQRKDIGDAKGRQDEREELSTQEDRCRVRRAKLVFRIEQRKWSKAVRAIYGDEGLNRCLEWMRMLPEGDVMAVASSSAKARKQEARNA